MFPHKNQTYADFLQVLRRSTDLVSDEPIVEEILSAENLELHATDLAKAFTITDNPKRGRVILPDLKKTGQQLLDAYLQLTQAFRKQETVAPAAEWFVDNFHIVEDQVREIKQDLPKDFYDELPKLSTGPLAGYPRVYAIALAIITHTDSRLDVGILRRFLKAYQQEVPLSIGELWATAITLRVALLENLKPLALRIVSARKKRTEADDIVENLLKMRAEPGVSPKDILKKFISRVGNPKYFDRAFVVQLTQRLRDQDPDVQLAFDWIELQLNNHHQVNTQTIIQLEHTRQAMAMATVGNIITSMRLLSTLDWREFIESVNLVDPILSKDPARAYSRMDFETRNTYRHVIEKLAKRSKYSEIEIAAEALSAAKNATSGKSVHVGYHLISHGVIAIEKKIGYRRKLREKINRWISRHPTLVYLGTLFLLTTTLLIPVYKFFIYSGGGVRSALCVMLLALIPASEFAISILNHILSMMIKPRKLPKMDMEDGIASDATTMVVIPTIISDPTTVRSLIESLQVHFLSNQDPNIYFALLSDFADADCEVLPEDEMLLELAQDGIDELNSKYATRAEPRFFFFHRKRLFNSSEDLWMGFERKRGKIHEFNRLLRGATDTSFFKPAVDSQLLSNIKYVITLDSDTELPRGSAHQLVAIAEHPLNRPEFDPESGRVVAGYGILQPRISVSLLNSRKTRFSYLLSGARGLDPYTTVCSDVYQDLFKEGIYMGKGLYVVDAFENSLAGRIPDNRVLSHDLFEGCFARTAFVSNVELFDDYPTNYKIFAKRLHRWIRGDWQIAAWILPRVPSRDASSVPNQLPLIARWKIFDNLRRSLVPTAIMLWLTLGWFVLPGSAFIWTMLVVIFLAFPVYATVSNNMFHTVHGVSWIRHLRYRWNESLLQTKQILVMLALMPNQAWNQTDAIIRTLYRKYISHKKLLEWTTFSTVQHSGWSKSSEIKMMLPGPIVAILIVTALVVFSPVVFISALPFIALWLINPIVNVWLRMKKVSSEKGLDDNAIAQYRSYARKTWRFFERFVNHEDNYLAPDNFQEEPAPAIAHRTSPTNIGIQLLSLSSAYDFGYVGRLEFIESAERTFATLNRMEKFNGHFYNWYNTQTLETLRPQYISTVDSGNLVGHLFTFKQALLELRKSNGININAADGLIDTFSILKTDVSSFEKNATESEVKVIREFLSTLNEIEKTIKESNFDSELNLSDLLSDISLKVLKSYSTLKLLFLDTNHDYLEEVDLSVNSIIHQIDEIKRDHYFSSTNNQDSQKEFMLFNERIDALADQCDEISSNMNFRFLFDEDRKLFSIGYNASERRIDNSYYDLLASEARLASFVAIAKGDIPQEHWFRLGRQLTTVNGRQALISWTGTMFEYLMPLLVTKNFEGTLLDQTYRVVVACQIAYGKKNNTPWGISESQYNMRDLQLMFQYRPFGVPGLGLKRGLSDDLVISPYSTMLAATVDHEAALTNLRALENMGALSKYGFYEAIDYTPERLKKNEKYFILRTLMAHHQGMSFISINNLLNKNVMQNRFHAEPLVQATQLLLHERMPMSAPLYRPRAEEVHFDYESGIEEWHPRVYTDPDLSPPRTQLLSNGHYSVMITTAGSGYSHAGDNFINRWREDSTRDHWGQFFYIRDRSKERVWSAGYQPTAIKPKNYEVTFAEDKVDFWRKDGAISTHTEIIVAPEENVEIRRLSLTNHSFETRELEVTSYMETLLTPINHDIAHPAFSKLFVQTEFVEATSALLATRRLRSENDQPIWAFHVLLVDGEIVGAVQYETNRFNFLGRNRNPSNALVIDNDVELSGTVGAVIDPIFSLRQSVCIAGGETARLNFATGVTSSREEALRLIEKYHDMHIFNREMELAWTTSRVQLKHLNINSHQSHTFQRLASRVIYSDPFFRPKTKYLSANTKNQSGLWAYGISGDLPIVIICIDHEKDMEIVRELLHAHEYLRLKGLAVDLVLLNERSPSYYQAMEEELQKQIRMSGAHELVNKSGGIFALRTDIIAQEDIVLLKSIARMVLSSSKGSLREQLKRRPTDPSLPEELIAVSSSRANSKNIDTSELTFDYFNGLGGFVDNGREYVIVLKDGNNTPAPWINVISNPKAFGFIVSESGGGYTWSVNSQENKITPWSNDAVIDPVGEVFYIRDEESGEYWTPTPQPIRGNGTYVVKHGQGYSEFLHDSHGISSKMKMFVPIDDSIKIVNLRLKNNSSDKRKISVTSYIEWVLGVNREKTSPHIYTAKDSMSDMLIATNRYSNEFNHRISFTSMDGPITSFTCDRKEFIGRNGSLAAPAALNRVSLSGKSGAGLDPCAALQRVVNLLPGEECEIAIFLGQSNDVDDARRLVSKYTQNDDRERALVGVTDYWDNLLGSIEISTPDPAMNILMNRWLLYQTLSCRIWGRSAFYQSGGAFGFRDQLQDVMALVYSEKHIARDQIINAASHQFVEGDVLHWWHTPSGKGVRTHFSDDLLWLPYVVSHYVKTTGDESILNEVVQFIEAPLLESHQESLYLSPTLSKEKQPILEHCFRAIDRSLKTGSHGLPYIGCGDWNDGMNRVGQAGEGESVWMAWFLYSTLNKFIEIVGDGHSERIDLYRAHMQKLKKAIEEKAWDGEWYHRAYFDDGTPLGSAENEECKIDSIAQSWGVISGAADPVRIRRAMEAVEEHLIDREAEIIKLFMPPFDKSEKDPGYIKGYLPGVRENGGQYTHAAIWTVIAFANLGDSERAYDLFKILNPILHGASSEDISKYKVEPYVIAADVYGASPHVGRGGWTWYTGAASWMYRAGLESILGFQLEGDRLQINPCIPKNWKEYKITYKFGETKYAIQVLNLSKESNPAGKIIKLDGVELNTPDIILIDDKRPHIVEVRVLS